MIYIAIIIRNYPFLIVSVLLNGFFILSMFSVAFEMGVELTFPIGEAMSGGFINVMSNLVGFVIIVSMTSVLENEDEASVLTCFIVFAALLLSAVIILALLKIRLKRNVVEKITMPTSTKKNVE